MTSEALHHLTTFYVPQTACPITAASEYLHTRTHTLVNMCTLFNSIHHRSLCNVPAFGICLPLCWKCNSMERYAIMALLHTAWNHTTTSCLINTVPACQICWGHLQPTNHVPRWWLRELPSDMRVGCEISRFFTRQISSRGPAMAETRNVGVVGDAYRR